MRDLLLLVLLGLLSWGCASRARELVVLVPDETGHAGQVTMATDAAPPFTLTRPYSAGEVRAGQPLLPVLVPVEEVTRLFGAVQEIFPRPSESFTLYFDVGGTRLAEGSQATVLALLQAVTTRGVAEVEITGHTDTVGTLERNDALALERATVTRQLLEAAGLADAFVRTVGRGERALLISTPDETAEPRNRRVEVLVR